MQSICGIQGLTTTRLTQMQLRNLQINPQKDMAMKPGLLKFISTLFLVFGLSTGFAANDAMQLSMNVEEEVEVTDAQGNRSLKRVPAESVIPGDTVVYTTRYHYSGEQAADNVVITNIIPKEVTFLPGSAAGSDTITFSIDGGKTFDREENLTISTADGKSRPAKAKDYTHIRWLLPTVSSGQSGDISFLSKVNEE